MRKFKRIFGPLPDPRAANRRTTCWRSCSSHWPPSCAGRRRPRTWRVSARQRKLCCGGSSGWSTAFPVTIRSVECFALLDPQAFDKAFRRFLAAFARPTAGPRRRHRDRRQGLAGRLRARPKRHAAAYGQRFAARARMAWPQRKAPGRNEAAGALEVLAMLFSRQHRYRRCAALPSRVRRHGARAGRQLRARAQAKSERDVRGRVERFPRAGTRSGAERLEPSTHDRREWRACHGHPRYKLGGQTPVPRRRRARPDHLAPTAARRAAERPVVRYYLLSK